MKAEFYDCFVDFGHISLNKKKETLCGDHYILQENKDEAVLVLSDGLGSGVKAHILATLTSQMLSTMLIKHMPLQTAVEAVACTLPVCSVRKMAYSTFTVLRMDEQYAYLAQYDNPQAIWLRDGKSVEYGDERHIIDGKDIRESVLSLKEGDMLILMSDGVTNAGMGKTTDGGWGREEAVKFCEKKYRRGMSAQSMAIALADACVDLNLNETDDDITVLVLKLCPHKAVNLMIGLPADTENDNLLLKVFFKKEGKHVVCGGTTGHFVSSYLNKPLITLSETACNDVPAMSRLEGVDLVTEGYLTLLKLKEYLDEYQKDAMMLKRLRKEKDGAAQLARMLLEDATDINIFLGHAQNPAHDILRMEAQAKQKLVGEIKETLEAIGRKTSMSFW
ncbi:MAG: PP2C family protein-serine/threonine phosphatase [Lachnospiraceae bacterium]|jgi:hypothetical protein